MRLFAQAGRFGPLHAGGSSQLLLAYADPAVIEDVLSRPLETFTPYTITDPDKLRQTLERIRASGYNIVTNDLDEGAFSVAAPIKGADGTVTASISIAGAVMRLDEERRAANLEAALEAGRRISEKLAVGGVLKAG
nr:IclR family transcriptional regulator C-terminal domain-containing protein [Martelella radicis]